MKAFLTFILYLLLALCITFLIFLGMDMELARRDYEKAITNGDYDKPITGCLFEPICKNYTERLFRK